MTGLCLALIEGFGNPSILWLVPLVAVPWLIYLFFRQRYQRVRWAAIEFLLRAIRKHRRRIRIENLLLLLLRTAAIAALVLCAARPVTRSSVLAGVSSGARHWILLIDGSYSMEFREGARSLFAAARDEVRDLVQSLESTDRVLLAVAADPPRLLFEKPVALNDEGKAEIFDALDDLHTTARGFSLAGVLAAVFDGIQRFPAGPAETRIVFWTDLQARDWLGADGGPRDPAAATLLSEIRAKGGRWSFVELGRRWPENLTALALEVSEGVVGVDVPLRFTARIRNQGPQRVDGAALMLRIDGEVQGNATVSLDAGAEAAVSFPSIFRSAGAHSAEIEVRSDPLATDNRAFVALEVRERVRVLVVDGEPEADPADRETLNIEIALSPDPDARGERLSPFAAERVTAFDLDAVRFPDYDIAILANVPSLADGPLAAFEAWLREGGKAIFFLGKAIDRDFYVRRLYAGGKGPFPLELIDIAGTAMGRWGVNMEVADAKHPIMRFFLEAEGADITSASVYRFWRAKGAGARILARYSDPDGSIAIAEGTFGAGRTIVVTTSADQEWNSLAKWPDFVALLYESLSYLAREDADPLTIRVGQCFHRTIPARGYASEVIVIAPSGRTSARALARKGDAFELEETATDEPGLYEVRYGGRGATRSERFAVNVDPEEGALKKASPEDLARAYPRLDATWERTGARSWQRGKVAEPTGGELWRALAYALLALLAVEGGLALWFGRRVR
ncbi:MAG: BatA domain-containing protein [Planctomycetes bacterium]|nr:BatA domain-containing protein [Planctomycetota bacterium]